MTPSTGPGTAEPTTIARFQQATKWYGPVIGVNDVTCALHPGVTGLLGPNGAGKTTLIKLLTGQLRPNLGEVDVCGAPAWSAAAKRNLGYCPEADAFYEEMSGRRFVRTMARLHGMSSTLAAEEAERALGEVGMTDRADRILKGCSKGMRQRIKLAQALVHRPRLLVVDEPLNGVDPVGRQALMQLFRDLARRGIAVLVSSHILGEMDELADRIIFMGRGRVLALGTLSEIRDVFADQPLRVRIGGPAPRQLATELITWPQVQSVDVSNGKELALLITRPNDFFMKLAETVTRGELVIDHLEATDVTAEATFNYVMSAAARF
ncbi:MAG: ABC transporter ATP-binding protein [Planctomycetaceae bacterium]|nr:ABC transporter ATP-binding protein [Planctomycetaceae bacterium]